MSETLGFRAHARLLTMLGEQLIKNERVALVELVKNSFDADATRVVIDFRGFNEDLTPGNDSAIVITDNGVGMTENLVRTAWMNPATPSKKLVKVDEPKTTLGRVLQGEKGIGRFATFKLGSEVMLTTRARGSEDETTLVVDISALDEEPGSAVKMDLFLEDVPAILDVSTPTVFLAGGPAASNHGAQIEIARLRASWNRTMVLGAFEDLDRLRPLMWGEISDMRAQSDFEVVFCRDGRDMGLGRQRTQEFESALRQAVLKVRNGRFDPTSRSLTFQLNRRDVTLSIDDGEIRGLKPFKERFLKSGAKDLPLDTRPEPVCGSFSFEFYVFDLDRLAPAQNVLDSEQRDLIKEHRTYLYRDGIRVYPYGDAEDDWLEIDVDRGTESAGRTLSNDQTVGYVEITQLSNPLLRDKTSREGLIDAGPAFADFKALIKTVLRYLRLQYQPHLDAKARAKRQDLQEHRIDRHLEALREVPDLPPGATKHLNALEKALGAERQLFAMQVGRTEQLAGVGLSVETASHDLIISGTEALRSARQIAAELKLLGLQDQPIYGMTTQLVSRLEFVVARFRDVQGLFVSTRQKPNQQDIFRALKRVRTIYAGLHNDKMIDFEIDDNASLRAITTEAAILQLLINLVDNATYWLTSKLMPAGETRRIRAFTPDPQTLIFTDNGPGVKDQDVPFIFEHFYSGKGEDGKGLGLYIARQNGLRSGFTIELGRTGDARELVGATFIVKFSTTKGADVDS